MSSFRDNNVRAATRRFEAFTGHDAETASIVQLPRPVREAFVIGPILAIEYLTVRDGETENYRHAFTKQAAPLLVSSFDGRQLMLIGGRYRFTDRGIVDREK